MSDASASSGSVSKDVVGTGQDASLSSLLDLFRSLTGSISRTMFVVVMTSGSFG